MSLSSNSHVDSPKKLNTKHYEGKKSLKGNKKKKCENEFCFANQNNRQNKKTTKNLLQDRQLRNQLHTNEKLQFCDSCQQRFDQRQYCYYCQQIYVNTTEDNGHNWNGDGQEWVQCDVCDFWQHIQCEQMHGMKNVMEIINQQQQYFCPWCRNKEQNGANKQTQKKKLKLQQQNRRIIKETSLIYKYKMIIIVILLKIQ
ncbi:hypothetical protein IMG5_071170 [Ichthyophthirius multifiliis]|uniref:PHD-type domain-containing protein n=1 Tax=Ichthyophthirius multifiliis TaxID=5932 RepID=G0QPU2_ICHMU|nr:hypothetical protein IMG5_071170 [Ichthyophthirius multifiliis]EGR32763.1 hypothetical protein IMG5_071170 [Ichthyophthirius multifiliis]|eukprot:XP_004036749.1 hypothetical protein IMG5_071170 [Ichthyophthirius multifiliis]